MEETLPEYFNNTRGKMTTTDGEIREDNPMTRGYRSRIRYGGQSSKCSGTWSVYPGKKTTHGQQNLTSGQNARPWRWESTIPRLSHKVQWCKGLIIPQLLFSKPKYYSIKFTVPDDDHTFSKYIKSWRTEDKFQSWYLR